MELQKNELIHTIENSKITTKEARQSYASLIVDEIEEGFIDPLETHMKLKAMEDILTRLTDRKKYPETAVKYSELLLDAAQKQKAKKFKMFGAEFELKEVGVKYDYGQCNDPEYLTLCAQLSELSEKVKSREKFLQTVPVKGMIVTDEETGETNIIYPPSKTSTTSIALSFK